MQVGPPNYNTYFHLIIRQKTDASPIPLTIEYIYNHEGSLNVMKSWTTTGHLGEVSIRPDNTGGGNLLFRIRCTDPLQTVDIDYVALYLDGYYQTETLSIDNPYTFGFNTQMKNNLISSEGNHLTAMYALNGFSGTVNCKITDLSGARVSDILVNRTFNSSNPITFGTPPGFTLNETGEYYIEFQATHNSAFTFIPGNPHLAATFISIIQMARTVTLTARDQTMAYRYGFNTQMKNNLISGEGNHYTAQYWEYDPRYGRRWNLDPVTKPWESRYSVLAGNPILNIDWLGDVVKIYDPVTKTYVLYTPNATKVKGQSEFVTKTVQALDIIHNETSKQNARKINYLVKSESEIIIKLNERPDHIGTFEPNSDWGGYLNFNPEIAAESDNGDKLSPAVILSHELEHAYRASKLQDKLRNDEKNGNNNAVEVSKQNLLDHLDPTDAYRAKEEAAAIKGMEKDTAKSLKQYQRKSHDEGMKPYHSTGVNSTEAKYK